MNNKSNKPTLAAAEHVLVFLCRQPSLLQLPSVLEFVSVFSDLCQLPLSHRSRSPRKLLFVLFVYPPLMASFSSSPFPPRMSVRGRSAWPWQVAFLVALAMLWADPASAGNRNHRGPTGTTRSRSTHPPLAPFHHYERLITLSFQRYYMCSLKLLRLEPSTS